MENDIVERLRAAAETDMLGKMLYEAADEIKRLRADITAVREMAKFREIGAVSIGPTLREIKDSKTTGC